MKMLELLAAENEIVETFEHRLGVIFVHFRLDFRQKLRIITALCLKRKPILPLRVPLRRN